MRRYYTTSLHRRCDHDGCHETRRLGVRDGQHGEIGKFCEDHARALVKKLNAEEDLRTGVITG